MRPLEYRSVRDLNQTSHSGVHFSGEPGPITRTPEGLSRSMALPPKQGFKLPELYSRKYVVIVSAPMAVEMDAAGARNCTDDLRAARPLSDFPKLGTAKHT